jgi:hypothetical protein
LKCLRPSDEQKTNYGDAKRNEEANTAKPMQPSISDIDQECLAILHNVMRALLARRN